MKFAITLTRFGTWTVHRADCKGMQREMKDALDKPFIKEAESLDALIRAELLNLEDSRVTRFDITSFHIKPCVRKESD